MGVNSKLLEVLPEEYGYVVLVGITSQFVGMWMGSRVGKARKEFGVEVSSLATLYMYLKCTLHSS